MTREGGDRSTSSSGPGRFGVFEPVPDGIPRPKWSVMIPVYNRAEFIPNALESVLRQDPGPEAMQIEVVDNASPDLDLEPLVRRIAGGRAAFFRQPAGLPMAENWNTCIRRARGELVHILHDDDDVLPGFYAEYREAVAETGAWVIAGPVRCIGSKDEFLSNSPDLSSSAGVVADAARRLAGCNLLRSPGVVVRRVAYETVGGFDARLRYVPDWQMWVRLAVRGPVAWLRSARARYRVHANTESRRLSRSAAGLKETLRASALVSGLLSEPSERSEAARAVRSWVRRRALEEAVEWSRMGDAPGVAHNGMLALRVDPSIQTLRTVVRCALDCLRR